MLRGDPPKAFGRRDWPKKVVILDLVSERSEAASVGDPCRDLKEVRTDAELGNNFEMNRRWATTTNLFWDDADVSQVPE